MRRSTRIAAVLCALVASACADDAPDPAPLPPTVEPRPALDAPPIPPRPRARPAADERGAPAADTPYLAVRVIAAASREPLPGVTVTTTQFERDAEQRHRLLEQAATTDADGVARFAEPLQRDRVHVEVRSPGYVRGFKAITVSWRGRMQELMELQPGTRAIGKVIDDEGTPLAGAIVSAEPSFGRDRLPTLTVDPSYARARCASDGSFELEGLPRDERCRIVADLARHATTEVEWRHGDGAIEIRMARAGSIRGVVRTPSGEPAGDARVWALRAEGDGSYEATLATVDEFILPEGGSPVPGFRFSVLQTQTDSNGAYELDSMPLAGTWLVLAQKDGFAVSVASEPVSLERAKPSERRDLALRRLARILLTIRPPADREAGLTRVSVRTAHSSWDAPSARWASPRAIEVADPGAVSVYVDSDGCLPQGVELGVAEGSSVPVEVTLVEGATVEGVVVDADGEPVADARVTVEDVPPGPWPSNRFVRVDTTGADGRFRLRGLGAGPHEVVVRTRNGPETRVAGVRANRDAPALTITVDR